MIKIAFRKKFNIINYIYILDFSCGKGTRKGINDWKKQSKKNKDFSD